ncbi:ead/Ea22-like family protein [Klebsiella pneumoniae]|uniref:ead/Ea22-like family protein n=1 Tax=Klebsiella pneumoniae complex TaxID=3390273 RepID=UPI00214FD3A2|nr:ead/Ea22-like family protein [Klebsiella pneumoniae]HBX0854913.1 ead/Ea22-like family protein [Klebsiella pneumoniae]HDU3536372.1 ead/Ea22-like family protein [Klebsiella variicola]HDU4124981.1 ead/Ea22-like family protein [Klebsiella pneumoniae subsp. pneumoniae]HDU6129293.1 ead/Ea22-like family protein [Klebsiella pneumoniae subsp. pneumoniae]
MTDITELAQSLKAAAEKATQGNWRAFQYHDGRCGIGGGHHDEIMVCEHISKERPHDAMFIALANPANVLALVEALEKAQAENEYIRKRYQQLDLLIGKNILVMQAAIIEWQATGDAKNGLAWIYNTLFGPGELPDEAEKDAQAYFDRKYAPLDEELMALHKWFWEQSEAERAAAGIKVEAE